MASTADLGLGAPAHVRLVGGDDQGEAGGLEPAAALAPAGKQPADFRLFPDVPAGCRRLKAAGFVLVVATNQPDVGRGTQPRSVVEAMHERLLCSCP